VQILQMLAAQGVSSVLVEAGQRLSTAMMDAGVVDALYWFRAPLVIGEGGLRAFALDGGRALGEMERYQLQHIRKLGEDVLEHYSFC
jgi:diaminohydroxyphosphoribosylaminopyrimidine deaminase/5-amino-6-(5-phosphoribosylamino)uracil reductase